MRTFVHVVVLLMALAILAGGVMTWVTPLSELSSTILLYYGPFSTMTVKIFSNEFGNASALAMILITATFVLLFLMYRFLSEWAEQVL